MGEIPFEAHHASSYLDALRALKPMINAWGKLVKWAG